MTRAGFNGRQWLCFRSLAKKALQHWYFVFLIQKYFVLLIFLYFCIFELYSQNLWEMPLTEFNFKKVSGQKPATLLKIEFLHRHISILLSADVEQLFFENLQALTFATDRSSHWRASQRDVLKNSCSTKCEAQCVMKIFKKYPWRSSFLLKFHAYYQACKAVNL